MCLNEFSIFIFIAAKGGAYELVGRTFSKIGGMLGFGGGATTPPPVELTPSKWEVLKAW